MESSKVGRVIIIKNNMIGPSPKMLAAYEILFAEEESREY